MLLGLSLVSASSPPGDYLKALLMTLLGLMLSTVGTDLPAGVQRFTFGRMDLIDGISFLLLAMATFALSEAMMMVLKQSKAQPLDLSSIDIRMTRDEIRSIIPVISRSSILGFLLGVLPGAGATIASFLAYGTERSLATRDEKAIFG